MFVDYSAAALRGIKKAHFQSAASLLHGWQASSGELADNIK